MLYLFVYLFMGDTLSIEFSLAHGHLFVGDIYTSPVPLIYNGITYLWICSDSLSMFLRCCQSFLQIENTIDQISNNTSTQEKLK